MTIYSITTLSITSLNSLIRRSRLLDGIRRIFFSCLQKQPHPMNNNRHHCRVKMEKRIVVNETKKRSGLGILISDKINRRPGPIRSDKEQHCMLIKGKIHQGNETLNLCAPNTGTTQYHKRNTIRSETTDLPPTR